MGKTIIVYWSGTGNTEAMANAVAEGAPDAKLVTVSETSADEVLSYDNIIMGCPAMGAEVLEEDEMEPLMVALDGALSGKNVGLFGSYGWGDGTWMHDWEDRVKASGANLVTDGVMANESPDDDVLAQCVELGKAVASL
ncbi:MAG: flavodoxin [Clostridia bacterium]|nr:flavodoxin [Clostridia bacterium]